MSFQEVWRGISDMMMRFTVRINQNYEDDLGSETDHIIQLDIEMENVESAIKWFDVIRTDSCTNANLHHYDPNNGVGDWIA